MKHYLWRTDTTVNEPTLAFVSPLLSTVVHSVFACPAGEGMELRLLDFTNSESFSWAWTKKFSWPLKHFGMICLQHQNSLWVVLKVWYITVPEAGFSAAWRIPADELLWGLWRRWLDLQRTRLEWVMSTDLSAGGYLEPKGHLALWYLPSQTGRSCWNNVLLQNSVSHQSGKTQERNLWTWP